MMDVTKYKKSEPDVKCMVYTESGFWKNWNLTDYQTKKPRKV